METANEHTAKMDSLKKINEQILMLDNALGEMNTHLRILKAEHPVGI